MADFFKIGQAAYGGGADVSKAIGAGLQKGQQIFMAYLGEQKAKREKAESLTKQYIAQIPNVNAISKIPEWMREDVNNYLASEKQRYVEAARALSTMSSSDPNYINAVNQLQSIQTNFSTLNNELNQFQEDTKNYTQDFDSNKISEGFKTGQAEKYTATSAMYTGQGKLNIQNGQLLFNIDGKDYNYSRGEIGDYSAKNFDAQTALTQLGEQIEMDARKGFTFESAKSRYKGKVDTFLTRNGKEGALSMVFDTDPEFITGGPSLQTPEILTAIAEDNFEGKTDKDGNVIPGVYDLITDQIMTGANTVHKGIYKAPEPPKTKPTTEDKSQKSALETFVRVTNDPVSYAKTYLPGAFVGGKGNIITLTIDEKPKRFDLKRGDQFMEFMNLVTEESGELSGSSESAKATKGEFYDLISKAKKLLNNKEEGIQRVKEQLMPQFFAPETLSDLPTTFN